MENHMKKYVVTQENGSIDIDKSTANFRAALIAQIDSGKGLIARIETAIDAVFDDAKGRLPKDMLIDNTLAKLSVNSDNHSSLKSAVEDYLRANTSKDKGVDGRRLASIKGQKGGIQRLALPGQTVTPLASSK